jgi:hypothetical protein
VAISREQAEIILQHQQAVTNAQTMLNLAFQSVLAGHGVTAFIAAGLDGYPDAPKITYRPTSP